MNNVTDSLDYLFSTKAIRERSSIIYEIAKNGGTNFIIHEDKILKCAQFVIDVIHENYPNLNIPFHSRWNHFQVGQKNNPKIDRLKKLNQHLSALSPIEKAKEKWNLVVPSVLLDAGAGMGWSYYDKEFKETFSKSEGLALASLDMYYAGYFTNASSLEDIDGGLIKKYFQVNDKNRLSGVDGRLLLLNNLAKVMKLNKNTFKNEKVGDLIDVLIDRHGKKISAFHILDIVLKEFGSIWPKRIMFNGVNLGDVWLYPVDNVTKQSYIPFHKLSQWLTYSLLEPLIEAGIEIVDVEKLTGLSEYRNGGLFLDFGVLELKDRKCALEKHQPGSNIIIEWRALTICLLDTLSHEIQKLLNKSEQEFPLAKILEGGTWWAGRIIAKQKRPDGGPPLQIMSDGTVF